jgi:protein involved in polysaccharide export with SLBB domain
MTVKDLLTAAGNLKRTAYLGSAELTRYLKVGKETQTMRMQLDLGKVLAGDPKENIVLQPYDQLSVKAVQNLEEPRTVKIMGEVLLPGSYTVEKGERLSSILSRAGGFTSGAYLRGAIFTRESAKKTQKLRLAKLIFEQEQEIARVSADIAAGALSPEEAESAQTILTNRMAAVEKLKRMPVTGRTVIHLEPLDAFVDSLYDLEVMPGDVLMIPENPMTVSVLGQVFNPVALTYRPGETVSSCLSRVGGPTENADTDQIFIVRADGTVFSKQQSGAGLKWDSASHQWIVGGFNAAELYPGDAILVPEKIDKTQWLRTTKDLSTIIYQMALGAAAVASF